MDKQRREFIHSFAGLGAMSAAAAALGAAGSAHAQTAASLARARGEAIKGPYLNLTTGKGNQLAWARLNGDLDETQQKHGWYKGYVMAVRPGKKVEDLFGFEGFDSSRLEKRADGSYAKILREVVLYRDLKTGEVLEDWHNPYIDETVRVVHVANDPYNYMIEEYAPQVPDYGTPKKEKPPANRSCWGGNNTVTAWIWRFMFIFFIPTCSNLKNGSGNPPARWFACRKCIPSMSMPHKCRTSLIRPCRSAAAGIA